MSKHLYLERWKCFFFLFVVYVRIFSFYICNVITNCGLLNKKEDAALEGLQQSGPMTFWGSQVADRCKTHRTGCCGKGKAYVLQLYFTCCTKIESKTKILTQLYFLRNEQPRFIIMQTKNVSINKGHLNKSQSV